MATNPRIPESPSPIDQPTGGMRPEPPKSGVTGTVLAVIVAVLLLAAIFYFMPRSPKAVAPKPGAEIPQQPTGSAIQIQDVKLTRAPNGGAITLQGTITNHGNQTINGLEMDVVFHGNGDTAVVGSERAKVMGLKQEGNSVVEDDLITAPIKPNDTRSFRITVDSVPSGWNQQMPGLKVATVTSHP